MVASCEVEVANSSGLHCRPAVVFVNKAASFKSKIVIENLTKKTPQANAKSPISVLSIAVDTGNKIRITATGEDAEAAVAGLKETIENDFIQM